MEIAYPYGGELRRKHGFVTAEPFHAKAGIMSGPKRAQEMEILRQRFQSELVAVRRLLHKAAAVLVPASSPSAPRVRSRPGFLAEEPPAKKRKASPPVPVINRKKAPTKKKMTTSEKEMLAEDLELFVAEIPDHIVELLKKQGCATRPGEIEIDLHALDDAAVVELQEQVDKFARERRAANPSPQEGHQDGPQVMAEEEEEEDEEVDICGGVSPLAIVPAPLLQLVEDEATGGSPSSSSGDSDNDDSSGDDSSGSDSDSEDEDVDICGGVSPLPTVPAARLELIEDETTSGSPGSSSRDDSDNDSSDSDSDSENAGGSSDSDSDSEYNTARPNNLLRQIGLYLKVDDDGWKQQRHQSFHEDLEEGEILS